jgi:hypothetical protein
VNRPELLHSSVQAWSEAPAAVVARAAVGADVAAADAAARVPVVAAVRRVDRVDKAVGATARVAVAAAEAAKAKDATAKAGVETVAASSSRTALRSTVSRRS